MSESPWMGLAIKTHDEAMSLPKEYFLTLLCSSFAAAYKQGCDDQQTLDREPTRNDFSVGTPMRAPGCTCTQPANQQAGHQGMCPLRTQDDTQPKEKK